MVKRSPISANSEFLPTSSWQFLILQAQIAHAEGIIGVLRHSDLDFTYDVTVNLDDYQQLLENHVYDLIIFDHHGDTFNGWQVINHFQQSQQNCPLILVTDYLTEEMVLAYVEQGITDYVFRERLFRLPIVVRKSITASQLYYQQELVNLRIERQIWRESILSQLLQKMRESLILEEIMQTVTEQLHQALGVSRCLIFQPNPQREMRARYVSESTFDSQSLIGISCEFYTYYYQELARGEQIVIDDFSQGYPPIIEQAARDCEIQSILITPLIYQDVYEGGISLHQCDRTRQWQEDEILLLQTVANSFAIAIGQANLYQQLQDELQGRKQAQLAIEAREQRFQTLLENASDIIILIDDRGNIDYVSPAIATILDYDPELLINRNIWQLIHPEDDILIQQTLVAAAAQPNISQTPIEYRMRDHQGSWHICEAIITDLSDNPNVGKILLNCRNISSQKQIQAQLQYHAFHDQLTGLPNRALLLDRLSQALKRQKRKVEHTFAVIFIDLDRFKSINDSLGYIVGDQLLIAIAHRLRQELRSETTIACLGGDEFAILAEDLHDLDDAMKIAHRIEELMQKPFLVTDQEVFLSASIGVALYCPEYQQPEQILQDADLAMYHAKVLGKSRIAVFTPSMHNKVIRKLYLETDLRRAIEHQEMVVYYQPIISLKDNKLQGFEALVRWQHRQEGLISPLEFISIAEETGLIINIDQWVLRQACQQLLIWQKQFPTLSHLKVNVNLSGKQFCNPEIIHYIDQVLAETGLDGKYLKLEITESVLIENAACATEILTQLQARKIQVCMDDFGTGYSSLSYLHRFPINVLKIDRSFISNIDISSNSTIVRTIITMAHELGIELVAEGVETSEQIELLKTLGCNCVQGYFYSRPQNSQEMSDLISSRFV